MKKSGLALLILTAIIAPVAFATAPIPSVPPPTVADEAPIPEDAYITRLTTGTHAKEIGKAYGVEHAHEIEAMVFAFNVQFGDRRMRREWHWDVADNRIEYRGDGPTGLPINHVYRRDELEKGDEALNRAVDQMFVDDQYWLLFPLHLAWERDLTMSYEAARPMYIEPRDSECVTVRYPDGVAGGGDIYEIFVGADQLIREWAYIPQGWDGPALVTTWERHAKAGPVLFSLMHRSDDGEFRIWFDRVAVKLVNQGWVDAQPLEQSLTKSGETGAVSKNPL